MPYHQRHMAPIRLALLWLVLACGPARGQSAGSVSECQDYLIEVMGTNGGLPANSITNIAQTPEGYLWAGTLFSGLLRYDGARFVSFNPHNTSELTANAVRRLMTDRSGLLWICAYNGSLTTWDHNGFSLASTDTRLVETLLWSQPGRVIFAVDGGQIMEGVRTGDRWNWTFTTTGSELLPNQVCVDPDGRVWFLLRNHELGMLEHGSIQMIVTPPDPGGGVIRSLAVDSQGTIWAGTDHCLFHREGGRFINRTPDQDKPMGRIRKIISSGQSLWVECDEGLRRFADGNWRTGSIDWKGGEQDAILQCAQGDSDGGFWAASNKLGLIHLDPEGNLRILSTKDGLPGNSITSIFQDHEGNIWLGYFRGGMVRVCPRLFHSYGRSQGFTGSLINSVCEDADGATWIGTAGTGAFRLKDGRWDNFPLPSPVAEPNTVVTVDRSNQVWECSHGGPLMRFAGDRFIPVVSASDLPHFVNLLLPARDGKIWMGASKSIGFVEGGRFSEVYLSDDIKRRPAALVETTDGTIWAGTFDSCLMRWNGQAFVNVGEPQEQNAMGRFWSMCPTPDGGLWIGTSEGGLLRWINGKFRRLTTANGLHSDCVVQVLNDLAGNLWLVTSGGIERIDAASLEKFERGGLTSVPVSHYGISDGLMNFGGSIEFQPNCWRGRNGVLWFAMGPGLANVQPDDVRINPVPPAVAIEGLRVNQIHAWPARTSSISVSSTGLPSGSSEAVPSVTALPGQRDLEFQFTGLSFRAAGLVRFQYRLDGFDKEWHSVGGERLARYYAVPPGNYVFKVKAANSDNLWNPRPASLALYLPPRFYQTPWFQWTAILAAGLLLSFTGWFVARRRMRRRLEILESHRKLERDRARIAKDMHDELGSKLARISYISELAKQNQTHPGPAVSQINTIAETSRELLRSMDEIVWAVNPKNDTLEHLAAYLGQHASDYLQNTSIECRIEIPSLLPHLPVSSETRHHLFLSFKESLTNILKHSAASHVRILMSVTGSKFEILVADDGIGMEQGLRTVGIPASEADGLRNMQLRLAAVGGSCDVESSPGKGTIIRFSIPLKEKK